MAFRSQRVRDPLHDIIEFDADKFDNVLWEVINTTPFQRLRRIKQLGFSEYVFPGATHSRFAHSLGVFHTARRLMDIVERHLNSQKHFDPDQAKIALAAALVHDVGHGPFSHAFEEVGKKLDWKLVKKHELVSVSLIREGEIAKRFKQLGSGFANDVADLIGSERPSSIYAAVVSSQFDADRLDYMRRDRLMTGTQHAGIDFEWLLANLEVGVVPTGVDETPTEPVETFVLGSKAIHAAEAYVLGLFQLYPTVYFHKTTRCFEKLYSQLLLRLHELVSNSSIERTGMDARHPLVAFCLEPNSIDKILALDDACITGAYGLMALSDDEVLRHLAIHLKDRKRLKCIDVREEFERSLGWQATTDNSSAIDRSCAKIELHAENWVKSRADTIPALFLDHGVRPPYRQLDETKGPLNQIRIKVGREKDAPNIDIRDRSRIIAAIQPFKFNRIYVAHDESERFVHGLIREEIDNVRKGNAD
jgi:HD superfamily phosphohydrolase